MPKNFYRNTDEWFTNIQKRKTLVPLNLRDLNSYLAYPDYNVKLSWGIEKQIVLMNEEKERIALVLKVRSFLHKGYVAIWLNGNDLFEIEGFNPISKKVTFNEADLYFDMLQSTIDFNIENNNNDNYKEKCDKQFYKIFTN